ncbi:MAG: HD domain-containing protein [Desulforudis sp.]|nr:MAG: HD domain-containing protein [Desulforudis sp.]
MLINGDTLQHLYRNPRWWKAADRMREWSECLFQHSLAVADLALQIGLQLGLSGRECQALQAGGFLHDLGKVTWPRYLVSKSALDDADWQIIRVHPLVGAKLAEERGCCCDETVLRIIREHHEHGNGYPTGIRDVHPLSRIVIAVEVYVAMTEKRPYRPVPMPAREALGVLAGNGHSPEALAALERLRNSSEVFRIEYPYCL